MLRRANHRPPILKRCLVKVAVIDCDKANTWVVLTLKAFRSVEVPPRLLHSTICQQEICRLPSLHELSPSFLFVLGPPSLKQVSFPCEWTMNRSKINLDVACQSIPFSVAWTSISAALVHKLRRVSLAMKKCCKSNKSHENVHRVVLEQQYSLFFDLDVGT
eukprot:scaffold5021_cov96-Amphora_coffeaeformis.AAC.2